jgi:hypothetical protein
MRYSRIHAIYRCNCTFSVSPGGELSIATAAYVEPIPIKTVRSSTGLPCAQGVQLAILQTVARQADGSDRAEPEELTPPAERALAISLTKEPFLHRRLPAESGRKFCRCDAVERSRKCKFVHCWPVGLPVRA